MYLSRNVTHICHLSGGVASWLSAKRVAQKYGTKNIVLLFADVKSEEKSTYRFLDQCAEDIGAPLTKISDGRTPWEVFRDVRFLGNSRVDPCSKILKRELMDAWVKARYSRFNCIQYFGYDWTEEHRLRKVRMRFAPWRAEALLMEPPLLSKEQIIQSAADAGLSVPLLYSLGFEHNNCGGECVKAGQAHYARLYYVLPASYAHAEEKEKELRDMLGDVAILRDRTGGTSTPLPLSEFRARIESGDYDKFDYGSCSCFTGSMEDAEEVEG